MREKERERERERTSYIAAFGKGTYSTDMKRTSAWGRTASLSDSSHGRSEIDVGNSIAKYAYVLNSPTLRIGLVRYGSRLSHRNDGPAVTMRIDPIDATMVNVERDAEVDCH